MSIIKNSYGKWLHVTLKLYSEEADSITPRSHCDARLHRNNLLMEHIQENESNAYTKITDIEHSSATNDLDSSGNFINILVSPEATLFLMNMEIRPSMHMVVLSENIFDDQILNSFHINTHTRTNYAWVGMRSDKLFGFP